MDPYWDKAQARAALQGGRLHYDQLIPLGWGLVRSWIDREVLTRTRPKVYALGYVRTDLVAQVWDAILYAGPGAYLTGASGAYQCELIAFPPPAITVATPRKIRSLPGIIVLSRRPARRDIHRGIPVAPIPALMLELAAEGNFTLVRKALATLDYRHQLDVAALLAMCTSGRRGATLLRRAITHHLPQLAYTNGPLEEAFVILLDAHHLPLPRCNVKVHGILVDAYWPELNLVVELDGRGNHHSAAQKRRDANYMQILTAHGVNTIRFDWGDVHHRQSKTLTRLAAAGVRH